VGLVASGGTVPPPPSLCEVRVPPRRPLPLVLAVALAAVLAACQGAPVERDEQGRTVVGDVALAVPDGWETTDVDPPPGVLEAHRWRPDAAELTGLQLVLGCGGTVDELVEGAVGAGRGVLGVVDAAETEGLDVPGLDEVRSLVLDLESPLAAGGTGQLRTAGLYGQTGDALLLLELSQPPDDFDPALAEEVFASLEVDGADLDARCAEAAG
jgi:hypothetical protein